MIDVSSGGTIAVEDRVVHLSGDFHFEAPKAAAFLRELAIESLGSAVEDLLEHGAAAAAAVQASAGVMMLEAKIAELLAKLDSELADKLGSRLQADRDQAKETTLRLLKEHSEAITQVLGRYVDPNSKEGLPQKMAEMLEQVTRNAVRQVDALLQSGDESALGKLAKQLTEQIKEAEGRITREITTKNTLLTKSVHRGEQFEEALAARLPALMQASGARVEHCARTSGDKARNAGDYVITLDDVSTRGEDVRIAIEAKSQKARFSAERIRQELNAAKANRGAIAGIFVAQSTDVMPDGLSFGQVSATDYFAVFDPEIGDELGLICAIYLARVAALSTIGNGNGKDVDLAAAQREVAAIRKQLDSFARIEVAHTRIEKEVESARTVADDIKSGILAALRRLDGILTA